MQIVIRTSVQGQTIITKDTIRDIFGFGDEGAPRRIPVSTIKATMDAMGY
jgi:hypothetical protein